MIAKNSNFGKVKSVAVMVAMILGATGGSILLTGNADAASSSNAIAATHYSWHGYNGNETIYMTKGVQHDSYYLPENNSTVYQNGNSNQANISNQVALDFGAKLYAPSGLKPTYETYSNAQGDLLVYYGVTIATATNQSSVYNKITQGSSVTTTTEELISSYVNATGFPGINSGIDGDTIASYYAAALNDSLTALSGLNNSLGLSLLMGAISAIPYLGYFTIPIALSLTQFVNETNSPSASFDGLNNAQTVGFYVKQFTGYYDKWLNNSGYQNDYNYAWGKNLMSFSVGSYIEINQTDFGGSGDLVVNATNMLGNYGGGGVSTAYVGASKSLHIPMLPANTLTGVVTNNGVPASKQEILLTQDNVNGSTTQFYGKTDANGNYRFFAKPGLTYEIQAVNAFGQVSTANSVVVPSGDYNTTYLNLSYNSATVTFDESGLQGQGWSVTLKGSTGSVTSTAEPGNTSLKFEVPEDETYSFSVPSTSGYNPNPLSGSIDVTSNAMTQDISFSLTYFSVSFSESGFPTGHGDWSITLNGKTESAAPGYAISFSELDGSYSYTASELTVPVSGQIGYYYIYSASSGSVTVYGSDVSVHVQYYRHEVYYSVIGQTKILIAPNYYLAAKDIAVGMDIMTYNLSSNTLTQGKVLNVYEVTEPTMYTINGYLKIAGDQPVYTNQGWITAQNLSKGDSLLDPINGHSLQVRSIQSSQGSFTMYDFEVSVNGNFIAFQYLLQEGVDQ